MVFIDQKKFRVLLSTIKQIEIEQHNTEQTTFCQHDVKRPKKGAT